MEERPFLGLMQMGRFSCVLATVTGQPRLFRGDNFAHNDIGVCYPWPFSFVDQAAFRIPDLAPIIASRA
jgi:hypothetical protein